MRWVLDPAHTSVGFSAKHMGLSTVRGLFKRFSAHVELDDPNDPASVRGRVEVDMSSVDTGNEMRDQHLRGEDFFDVERYPAMTFVPKSVTPSGDGEYTVVGDLTIKDVTREVTLTYEHGGVVTDPYGNRKVGGSLTGTINRSDWGLKWNVPLGGGGLLVSETIRIEVEGQLAESKEAVQEEIAVESTAA